MNSIHGKFYQAGSSDSVTATVRFIDDRISLKGEGFESSFEFNQTEISDRLASLPRRFHFAGGGLFSTRDNLAVDKLLAETGHTPRGSVISFFESGWRWTLLAVAAIVVSLYLLFTLGMPIIAAPLAQAVPESLKDRLDVEIIAFLDSNLLEPSELSDEKKNQLKGPFDNSFWTGGTSLEFRKGALLGANALALPGGTIIITDELVELIEFDGEFYAVMAHEVGHIRSNHALRNILQTAGITMVLGWMLGDLSMVTDMVLVGLPVLLQQLSYSRAFEHEADQFALVILRQVEFSTACFSSLMEKLSKAHGSSDSSIPSYLSSHPEINSRIELGKSVRPCSADDDQINWGSSVSHLPSFSRQVAHVFPGI